MLMLRSAAFAILLVSLALGLPVGSAHHFAAVQPGSLIADLCTTNFVFTNASGEVFIGTAAHCVKPGRRVLTPELGIFGTVVYHRGLNLSAPGQQNDFALIRVDDAFKENVSAEARYWGGPTGIQESFAPGDPTYHYGQGVYFNRQEATRHRTGVLEYVEEGGPYDGWYLAMHPLYGGDSGSGLLGPEGKAVGVVSAVAPTFGRPGYVFGPTFELIMTELERDGWELELVTADFPDPTSAVEILRKQDAEEAHCEAQPYATPRSPDGCLRVTNFAYRQLSIRDNATRFSSPPWIATATPDERLCNPSLKPATNWLWDWCKEYVVILNGTRLTWPTAHDGLVVGFEWEGSATSLDVRVYDASGQRVGVERISSESAKEILIPEADSTYYRVVLQPVYSAYTGQARGFEGYAYLTIPEANATVSAVDSPPSDAIEDVPGLPAPLAAAILFFLSACWRKARRNDVS